jgi:ribosomal protein L24
MKKLPEEQRVIARKETMRKAHKKYQDANREKINAYQNMRNAKIRLSKKMAEGDEEEISFEKANQETSTCVCSTCGHVHISFK